MFSNLDIRNQIVSFLEEKKLPKYDEFISLCNSAVSILKNENSSYRFTDSSETSGGLLDFTLEKYKDIPVLIVPDLHARGHFLLDILDFEILGKTVLELLSENKIIVCCVGDIFHSEARAKERWNLAYKDFCAYYYDGEDSSIFSESDAMKEEMFENLSLLEILFTLKKEFPENFHVLKGNHENIKNASYVDGENLEFGNRSFRKFCEEGIMCSEFLKIFYDDLFVHCISSFEKSLPLCAVFKNCIVSHAEPAQVFTRDDIINGLTSDSVVFGLTWTANDVAQNGTVEKTMKNLYKKGILSIFSNSYKESVWIGGHRPIQGLYSTRQEGLYIQIHNPEKEYISLVYPYRKFRPDTDIFDVNNSSN